MSAHVIHRCSGSVAAVLLAWLSHDRDRAGADRPDELGRRQHSPDRSGHQPIVGEIKGVPINHGAAAAPDGRRLYFSSEAEQTLHVVDGKTLQTTKKIPLTGRPNNISIAKDGRRVYVGIVSAPGAVDVIDTETLEKREEHPDQGRHPQRLRHARRPARRRRLDRRPPDDRDRRRRPRSRCGRSSRRACGRWRSRRTPTDRPSGSSCSSPSLHGFAIVDFAQRKEVGRVTLPDDIPAEKVDKGPFNASPSHGLGVAPDGKTLWVTSRPNARVYAYSLPDLKLLGTVDLGGRPDWVTFTPDSKLIYIATENTDSVLAIDVASRKEVRADHGRRRAEAEHHGGDALKCRSRTGPTLNALRFPRCWAR